MSVDQLVVWSSNQPETQGAFKCRTHTWYVPILGIQQEFTNIDL